MSERTLIGRIVKSARLFHEITQAEAATLLNVKQSTISKIEKGQLEPGVFGWHQFLDHMKISNIECFKTGYIEIAIKKQKAGLNDECSSGGFKIHEKYADNKNITVRKIIPLIHHLDSKMTPKYFDDFLKRKGMKREFFYILNNPINTVFELDLINLLLKNNLIKSLKEIESIQNYSLHGKFSNNYEKIKTSSEIIKQYIKNQKDYCTSISYSLLEQDNGFIISVTENDNFRNDKRFSKELITLYEEYNLYYPYNLQKGAYNTFSLGDKCSYDNKEGVLELIRY